MADVMIMELTGKATRILGPTYDISVGDVVDLAALPSGALHEIVTTEPINGEEQ